jgi:hypothetical protein
MHKLFLDCEFNGHGGELLSMALVPGLLPPGAPMFYEVLRGTEEPVPWVRDNVLPVLSMLPGLWVDRRTFQQRLQRYLLQFGPRVHIVADWPEDIRYFCEVLITGPGERIDTPILCMEVRRDIDTARSAIPHNALEDAYALRECYETLMTL